MRPFYTPSRDIKPSRNDHRGFTLIEMLVASALVVLMMTIFAEVFQMASGSMTLQRTIAENDQQVRTFTTIMRGDLQKRTFRNMVPYYPHEDFRQAGASFSDRDGYFYLSQNDPINSSDTLLQFTVSSGIVSESSDETPYYGRATFLGPQFSGTPQQILNLKNKYLRLNPNQPESDDGQVSPNSTASSSSAEVCYFVRGGNLYRRVVLIREPLSAAGAAGSNNIGTVQPVTAPPTQLRHFDPANNLYPLTANYWEDFDFAAIRLSGGDTWLLGVDATSNVLNNQLDVTVDSTATPLGQSRFRFGFDNTVAGMSGNPTPYNGLSREYFGSPPPSSGFPPPDLFLGRYTHQETSSSNFKYPYQLSPVVVGGNPFAADVNSVPLTPTVNGEVSMLNNGSRASEDLLLTHVHSFEVELFDEQLGRFAPIGHSEVANTLGITGSFHIGRNLNANYFPPNKLGLIAGQAFDSWHPNNRNFERPPYRPLYFDPVDLSQLGSPPALSGAGFNESSYVPGTVSPLGYLTFKNAGNTRRWVPGANYRPWIDNNGNGVFDSGDTPPDIVFPPTEDLNYDGVEGPGESGQEGFLGGMNPLDWPPVVGVSATSRSYYYVCRKAADGTIPLPSSYSDQPSWSTTPGRLFGHDSNPAARDHWPVWEAVPNTMPVRAVRLTIRFLHRGSNKLRQVTLVHALKD